MTNTEPNNPETRIPQVFHFDTFPKYFIFLYSHVQKLEIWRIKNEKNINLLSGEFKKYTPKYIVKNLNGLYAFRRNEIIPKSVNKPLGVAFEVYPGNGSFLTYYPATSSIAHPTADDMRNIAIIADKLNKNSKKKFVEYNRALELFVQWEKEAHAIRVIQNILSLPEFREVAPEIANMLNFLQNGVEIVKKINIEAADWVIKQHIKICINNIKNTTDILAAMKKLI